MPLVGRSEAFLDMIKVVGRVARHGDATVLIRGETGTGKELVARATHYLGRRSSYPFVPVNCGALPEDLIENELFGHRAGAYTGAGAEVAGLIRLADRGTLFLDEIDALPLKAQVSLLRFLQDGCYRPLGGQREEASNVRVVAACNGCLEDEVKAGHFRRDLYYRLNLLSITVPPLRERGADIPLLSKYFLREFARRYASCEKDLHSHTLSWFLHYDWPGNVRELENLVHREYLICEGRELLIRAPSEFNDSDQQRALLGERCAALPLQTDALATSYHLAKAHALEQFDRAYLTELIHRTHGNVTQAAALAGKERRAMGKLLKRYGIGYVVRD
ncbi:sigma 54-interacting transcriptional regulator [Lysobacter gummosus]